MCIRDRTETDRERQRQRDRQRQSERETETGSEVDREEVVQKEYVKKHTKESSELGQSKSRAINRKTTYHHGQIHKRPKNAFQLT